MRNDIYYCEWDNPANGWKYRLHIYPANVVATSTNFVEFRSDSILKCEQTGGFDSLPIGRPDAQLLKIIFRFSSLDSIPTALKEYLANPIYSVDTGGGGSSNYNFLRDIAKNKNATNAITLYSDRGQTGDPLGEIQTISLLTAGTGYISGTAIGTTGGSGSSATVDIVATVIGEITVVTLISPGIGYTAGTETVTGGAGAGATVDITVDGPGSILTAVINNGGSGYAVDDLLTVVNGSGGEVKVTSVELGAITSCVLNAGGAGYEAGDVVTISGGGSGGTFEVLTIDEVVIPYVVEFAGCQKKNPTHKLQMKRASYNVTYEDMEIEFVDLAKIVLENSVLTNLDDACEGLAAVVHLSYGEQPRIWGFPALSKHSIWEQYWDKAQFLSATQTQFGEQTSEAAGTFHQDGINYTISAIHCYTLNQIYTSIDTLLGYIAPAVHRGLDTTAATYIPHDHANFGVIVYAQDGSTDNSGVISGLNKSQLYTIGLVSERKWIAVDEIKGGVLSQIKGSWNEQGNLWNFYNWFASNFGVRLRWYYETPAAPYYKATLRVKAEPIFLTNSKTIDLFNHRSNEHPEIEIGALSVRTAEAHAKNREFEKWVRDWKYETVGSDAEKNAEFQLLLSNAPAQRKPDIAYTTGQGLNFIHVSTILKLVDGDEQSLIYNGDVPAGKLARVNENCVWSMGDSIFRRVQSSDADPNKRALDSSIGALLTFGIVDIFGRYEQAEFECEFAYSGDYAPERLGQMYAVTTRLPAEYAYLGTDAIYTKFEIDHLTGTVKATFFLFDTSGM